MTEWFAMSERDDWQTPPALFARLHREFGFTLDACASDHNRQCVPYYTKDQDALTQEWTGVVWMNPPYGRDIGHWMRKAWESARDGATVVCLVPARTDTAWWHDYAMSADEIRLVRGRIRFVGAPAGAPFPSAIVVFRPDAVSPRWTAMDREEVAA